MASLVDAVSTARQDGVSSGLFQRLASARIGKYEIESEIGQGTVVKAFRALDRDTGRLVTLRVLTELADRALLERFRREAAIIATLHHKGVVGIYELGEHVGLPFVAAQHLGEEDLRMAIRSRESLTLLQKMLMMRGLAEGLQAAHAAGLACVGLHPAGVALGRDGTVTLQDFGIVRLIGDRTDEDLRYKAPEELDRDSAPDTLCDVFAYGAIYYELLTGTRPLSHELQPLLRLAPECPEPLMQLVHRALSQERELRYQSMEDLQCDAEPVLRALKRARAAALLQDVRQCKDSQQWDQAQAVVREILDLDPDNLEAHELRRTLRDQLQRQIVTSRLGALWQQADEEAAARRFGRAVEVLEAAVRLDQASPEAKSRLEQMRSRLAASQRVASLLAETRELLSRQNLTEAYERVSEAVLHDPQDPEASELLKAVGDAMDRRKSEARAEQALAKAKSLLLLQSFDEAISILSWLWIENPGSSLVEHWLAHAREQKAEAERQARLHAGLEEARALGAAQQFEAALGVLEELSVEFPRSEGVAELVRHTSAARDRALQISQTVELAEQLFRAQQFEPAFAVLEAALETYPADSTLTSLWRDAEQQCQEFRSSTAAGQALDEAKWLIEQDRPDLAVPLLREKSAEFPGQAQLVSELESAEKTLVQWEKHRFIEEALNRVGVLEQRSQWEVALTVLDEALEAYPGATDLLQRVEEVRNRLRERERNQKLARRLDAIEQKLAAQAWPHALLLISNAQAEFPDQAELQDLAAKARAGLKNSECESTAAVVRQFLADGEFEEAKETLRQALEAYPQEATLQELRQEIEANRTYHEEWRTAQVFFGRGQYQEAERVLVWLATKTPGNNDVKALLEAVRGARASSEEKNFCQRGREKAMALLQQHQFEQAVDLLNNLLSLFPGDPILERDLRSALSKRDQRRKDEGAAAPAPEPAAELDWQLETVPPDPASPGRTRPAEPSFQALFPGPFRWLAFALPPVLIVAGTAVWRFTARTPGAAPAQVQAAPKRAETPARSNGLSRTPPEKSSTAAARQSQPETALPLPSSTITAANPDSAAAGRLTDGLPAPPATEVGDTGVVREGGRFQQPQRISGPQPVMPRLARDRGMYGVVLVEANVDKRGVVTGITTLNGDPLLASAARDAVLKWRYRPGTLNGEPVEAKVTLRFTFGTYPKR